MKSRNGDPRLGFSESRWLVLTSGMGSEDFEAAAARVVSQASRLPGVTRAIAVTTKDLPEVCPKTTEMYGHLQNRARRGWGYWAYKSEIIARAFDGYWGEFDGYVWIDSGCEVFVNPISAQRFLRFQQQALQSGATVFTLDTPEKDYTKRILFERFPELDSMDSSPQIQATFIFLAGKTGLSIIEKWLEITLENIAYADESLSPTGELSTFVAHRNDQSILSLVCKSKGVDPIDYIPVTGTHSLGGKVRAAAHPIWVSRNRTGKSVIPKFLQKLCGLY